MGRGGLDVGGGCGFVGSGWLPRPRLGPPRECPLPLPLPQLTFGPTSCPSPPNRHQSQNHAPKTKAKTNLKPILGGPAGAQRAAGRARGGAPAGPQDRGHLPPQIQPPAERGGGAPGAAQRRHGGEGAGLVGGGEKGAGAETASAGGGKPTRVVGRASLGGTAAGREETGAGPRRLPRGARRAVRTVARCWPHAHPFTPLDRHPPVQDAPGDALQKRGGRHGLLQHLLRRGRRQPRDGRGVRDRLQRHRPGQVRGALDRRV